MSSQAALFQILFQNDTLYQLREPKIEVAQIVDLPIEILEKQIVSKLIVKEHVVVTTKVEQVVAIETIAIPEQLFPELSHEILILIDEPKQEQMPVVESIFLDNILKAVKSSIDRADIINFSFILQSDARNVLAEKQTNYFITFGVPLIKLKLDLLLIPYTPKLVEGIWFLLTDPLAVIEADRDLKRKLWQALQKMFEKV